MGLSGHDRAALGTGHVRHGENLAGFGIPNQRDPTFSVGLLHLLDQLPLAVLQGDDSLLQIHRPLRDEPFEVGILALDRCAVTLNGDVTGDNG